MTTVNSIGLGLKGSSGSGSFVGSASPTLVTPILATPTATSLAFTSTSGIIGSTTNDSANTGSVGELVISSQTSGQVSAGSTTAFTICSVTFTAGDWDLSGNFYATCSSPLITNVQCGASTTSSLPDSSRTTLLPLLSVSASSVGQMIPKLPIQLSGSQTYNLVCTPTFSGGTFTAYGNIQGLRVR